MCILIYYFLTVAGEIVLTRSVAGEFVPAYDIYVTVNDGKTSTGPRSLTVHILGMNLITRNN